MADYGAIYTDKTIEDLDRKLKSVYREAQKDIEERMKEFTERYEKKEAAYAKLVSDGKMTEKEFDRWKQGQVFQGKQWQAKKEEIANTLYNSNKIASSIVNDKQNPVFMTNANYASYQMEHDAGVNFGFGLCDKNTVIRLIKDEPNLLPNYQPKKAKDMRWNEKKITRQVTQGIIQGESLDRISKRLALVTSSQNMNSMKTHARIVMTGAQNAGRLNSYKNAQTKGIDLEKEWMATLDSHTRDSHADIDGERVPVDAKFSNGLMYPGEAGGAPEEVYNCRCTMVGDIKKYSSKYDRYDNLNGKRIDNMSYKEWEGAKDIKPVRSKSETKSKAFSISDKIRSSVTPLTASDDWFEYENANAMSEYIKTGIMPTMDLNGGNIAEETRERLAAEAEIMQSMGSTTKTSYKTLYRGMVLDEDEARAISPGENYIFDTLSATATNKGIASIYTNVENSEIENGVPVIFEIQKSDGIFGFDRDGTEVVLPKGSEFRITRNWMDEDGKVHISLYAKKGKNVGD